MVILNGNYPSYPIINLSIHLIMGDSRGRSRKKRFRRVAIFLGRKLIMSGTGTCFFPRNSQMVRGTTKSQGEKPCFLPFKFARISYACSLRNIYIYIYHTSCVIIYHTSLHDVSYFNIYIYIPIGFMYGIYANMTGVYWWDPCYHIYQHHGSVMGYGSIYTIYTHFMPC